MLEHIWSSEFMGIERTDGFLEKNTIVVSLQNECK
jgi:hypothetical protein